MGGLTSDPDIVDLTKLDQEWDIPCDYGSGGRPWPQPHSDPASWVMRVGCSDCGARAERLICTSCKDAVIVTEDACRCPNCEKVISPYRHAVISIDPIRNAA